MKTPLTKENLKTHILYNWYKYLGLGIIAIGLISLFSTSLRYISPEEKRIDVLVTASYCSDSEVEKKVKDVAAGVDFSSEIETINVSSLLVTNDGSTEIVLASRIMLGAELDILLLPETYFTSYVGEGIFASLDDVPDRFPALASADLSSGKRAATSGDNIGEIHLYGIPVSLLPNLVEDMIIYSENEDIYMCVFKNNKNNQNVMQLFDALITAGLVSPETAPVVSN